MKRVSTTPARSSKKISQQRFTIELDLGDRNSWYCLLEEVGEVRLEQKLGHNHEGEVRIFGKRPRCRIALQTGMHSPWVSRVLSE